MGWDNDNIPATPEKLIKLKGVEYINRFRSFGVSLEKSKNCAVFLVMELKISFKKNCGDDPKFIKKMENFDKLIQAIESYC
jgi:hypothetical protein